MSANDIPDRIPRSDSDRVIEKSLVLPTVSMVILAAQGAAFTLVPLSGDSSVWSLSFCPLIATASFLLAIRAMRNRNRMRRVWRLGERIDVRVTEWRRNYSYWAATVVEHDGRHAGVMLRRAPDVSMKLPALVHENSIAVLDPVGSLRIGWLSDRQS
jgi:hypothetical protein